MRWPNGEAPEPNPLDQVKPPAGAAEAAFAAARAEALTVLCARARVLESEVHVVLNDLRKLAIETVRASDALVRKLAEKLDQARESEEMASLGSGRWWGEKLPEPCDADGLFELLKLAALELQAAGLGPRR